MKAKSKLLFGAMTVMLGVLCSMFSVFAINNHELLGKVPVKKGRGILYNPGSSVYVTKRKPGRLPVRDSMGDTLLHIAVRNGNGSDVFRLLIMRNVNINSRNRQGNTLLHVAVNYERWGIITHLIRYATGLNINAINNNGETPLAIARKNGTEALFRSCFPSDVGAQLV